MVNMEVGVPCPTALAPVPVALKHAFPVAAEVIPRVPAHPITPRAELGDGGHPLATGAKERLLPGTGFYPGPQDALWRRGEG
jgi:hypothetical protein